MQEFIIRANKIGLGVNFNTYRRDDANYCFIMITERGNTGRFIKEECHDYELNNTLERILANITNSVASTVVI